MAWFWRNEVNGPKLPVLKREAIIPVVTTRWIWTYVLTKCVLVAIATGVMMTLAR